VKTEAEALPIGDPR